MTRENLEKLSAREIYYYLTENGKGYRLLTPRQVEELKRNEEVTVYPYGQSTFEKGVEFFIAELEMEYWDDEEEEGILKVFEIEFYAKY